MALDEEIKRIGRELRQFRESVGLSLADAATRSGYKASTIENVEYGRHGGSARMRRALQDVYERARDATHQLDRDRYDLSVVEEGDEYGSQALPQANSYALNHVAWYISQPEWEPRVQHFMEISGATREIAARYLIKLELEEEKDRAKKKFDKSP